MCLWGLFYSVVLICLLQTRMRSVARLVCNILRILIRLVLLPQQLSRGSQSHNSGSTIPDIGVFKF